MSAGRGSVQDPRQNVEHTAIAIVDQFLDAADKTRASDIHIEPQGDKLLIRFRVDGRLQGWKDLPLALHAQVISRLKVISGMDISEKRMPQDGRFTVRTGDITRDYRIATVPMVEGEKRRLWIPEDLAYKGRPGAPQGMLVFDVELLKILGAQP